ncbi:MAG: hypothetical protein J3K34DRAFT_519707 [Monoraphidium minutum]|nr:MAG: hypothetical protein J3K34DRAFT_519707 [Monoraphidium minutum]
MGPPRGCTHLAVLLMLCTAAAVVTALAPKVACDLQDELCGLAARYVFGSAVINNTAYFGGGLDANRPTYPLPGSYLETLDTRTLAPRVLQTIPDEAIHTSRYRHQMLPWGEDRLVVVGGQVDDRNGASTKLMSVIELDLGTRAWSLRRKFTQNNDADLIWNWAKIYDDTLYMAVEDFGGFDPETGKRRKPEEMSRSLFVGNMSDPKLAMIGSVMLAPGISFLQLPLVTGVALDDSRLLILQLAREIASPSAPAEAGSAVPAIAANAVDRGTLAGALVESVSLKPNGLKAIEGKGSGGRILSVQLINGKDGAALYMWSKANAAFHGERVRQRHVSVLSRYAVSLSKGAAELTLTPAAIWVAVPPGESLGQLRALDLPMMGDVAISQSEVRSGLISEMPYVGEVDLVAGLDSHNPEILQTEDGLLLRGNSKPSEQCVAASASADELARQKPFVMSFAFPKGAPAAIRAAGANTLCAKRDSLDWVTGIQKGNFDVKGMRGVHRVETGAGDGKREQLLLVSPPTETRTNYFPTLMPGEPLMGALVDAVTRNITAFEVAISKGYKSPQYVAACVTRPKGGAGDVYLEYGGATEWGQEKRDVLNDVMVMAVPSAPGDKASIGPAAPAGAALPRRAQAAMACAPDGRAWVFGGLEDVGGAAATVWAPTADLSSLALSGGAGALTMTTATEAAPKKPARGAAAAAWPAPRYGADMVFLPPGVAGKAEGSLLLFGGSNGTDPELLSSYIDGLNSTILLGDTWLYDLAEGTWERVEAAPGATEPPPMMWHAMATDASSVLLYGGRVLDAATNTWGLDTNVYVLEAPLPGADPAWRASAVGGQSQGSALQTEFPNTAIVPLGGQLALQHEQSLKLTPAPQSVRMTGSSAGIAAQWAAKTADLTSGDWVVLAPEGGVLELAEPLTISGDILVTGAAAAAAPAPAARGRRLAALGGAGEGTVTLKCGKGTATALKIMSAGAQLRNLAVTGCNASAVHLLPDPSYPTLRYPESNPVQFHNVSLRANPGAGLRMDNGTAAALFGCAVERNGGGGGGGGERGAVVALAGSVLSLRGSRLAGNNGSAVNFRGVKLSADGCEFSGNAAGDGGGIRSVFVPPAPGMYVTNDTGTIVPNGGTLTVSRCAFSGNNATTGGGGLYVGNRMSAYVYASNFTGNAAAEGGGVHAARDGCLQVMRGVRFERNAAAERGGGLISRAPLCPGNSSMAWDRVALVNNSAAGDGGGAYVSEVAFRYLWITNSSFAGNRANGSRGRSGDGGGMYLGTWSSRVVLNGTALARNHAARSGGGVHGVMLSQAANVDLTLANCSAAGNTAGRRGEAVSEGGAVRVLGSVAKVIINGSAFSRNRAGQGGAISFGADRGTLRVVGESDFSENAAVVGGGAVLAGESAVLELEGAAFWDNVAEAPFYGASDALAAGGAPRPGGGGGGGAAGGGFMCFRCYAARVVNCTLGGNRAGAFGGGGAIVQPYGGAAVEGSSFADNSAGRGAEELRRRRALLAAADADADAEAAKDEAEAGKPLECGSDGTCANAGFMLGAWATTLDPRNPTGDDGQYAGGGGLYVSTAGPVNVTGTHFTGNKAKSGGGMLARTDMCPPGAPGCALWLLGKGNAFKSNNAGDGAGGGLLITKLSDALVKLPACDGPLDEATFRECLGSAPPRAAPPARGAARAAAGAGAARRRALRADSLVAGDGGAEVVMTAPPAGEMTPLNEVSPVGYGEDLASAATTAHFLMVGNATVDGGPVVVNASAAPGGLLPVGLQLRDQLQRDVRGDISDASMIVQAVLYNADGSPAANVTRLGNITRASNGSLLFPSLQVFALPGDYVVSFLPLDPNNRVLRPANLTLKLRRCMAGEAEQSVTAGDADAAWRNAGINFRCEQCRFGTYSVEPRFGFCVQCNAETNANCTGVAPIPNQGYWVSHPRSPLLHRCLVDVACSKVRDGAEGMYQWALRNRGLSVAELNAATAEGPPLYQNYTAMQCASGYEGTLCGECADGWGRRGYRCVHCRERWVNNVWYLFALAYMVFLVFVAGWMHTRQAEKRQRAATATEGAAFVGGPAAAARAAAKHAVGGGYGTRNGAGPPAEHVGGPLSQPSIERRGSYDVGPPEEYAAGLHHDQGYSLQYQQSGGRTPFESASGLGRAGSSPKEELPRVAEERPPRGGGGGGADDYGCFAGEGGLPPAAAVPSDAKSSRSWLQGLFSVDTLRDARPTLAAPTGAGDAAEHAARAAAAARSAARRPYRFWVSDILKLLVTHLQLLGLLRGLRINWPAHMDAAVTGWLAFFDQTSTVSSWVSLDCSLAEDGPTTLVRRSIKRTLAMLFMPIVGVLLGLLFWGAHGLAVRALKRRRPALRRMTWRTYYQPRIILTAVLVFFYLYPQVSNAVVSIFACTKLDADWSSFKTSNGDAELDLLADAGALTASAASGYWDQDTHYVCMEGPHLWLFGLGVVWVLGFCIGFPAAMAVVLFRNRKRLEEFMVDMRYGFFYDSYDAKYFFWESIVLVEKLLMVVAITLLQRYNATVQVLVALIIISLATVLQITFRPSGCNMLHTLQRASLYVLQATLFMLMLSNISEMATDAKVVVAALGIAAALNVGLVAMFLYAFWTEVRRLVMVGLGKEPSDHMSCADLRRFAGQTLFGPCAAAARAGAERRAAQHAAAAAAGGQTQQHVELTVADPPPGAGRA